MNDIWSMRYEAGLYPDFEDLSDVARLSLPP